MLSCRTVVHSLLTLACIGCLVVWMLVNSDQANNMAASPSSLSCSDICGSSYLQDRSGFCCLNGNQACKSKQTCQLDINSNYANLKFYLELAFGACLAISLMLTVYRYSQARRQARGRILYEAGVLDQRLLMPHSVSEEVQPNFQDRLPESVVLRDSRNVCAVCLESFSQAQKSIELGCGHIFHSKCIRGWTSTQDTCPLCREKI